MIDSTATNGYQGLPIGRLFWVEDTMGRRCGHWERLRGIEQCSNDIIDWDRLSDEALWNFEEIL